MKGLILFIMLVSNVVYAEEIYYVRTKGADSVNMIPLSSISAMSILVLDSINFDYKVNIEGVDLLDCKIYANFPLYDKVDGRIKEIQSGFNVAFSNVEWLVAFLKNVGLFTEYKQRNIYTFLRRREVVINQ